LPKFCHVARAAGVDGTLITDLPVEEASEYLREARKNQLATIFSRRAYQSRRAAEIDCAGFFGIHLRHLAPLA
jgi:tryptophan synthase alpha subunit